MSLKTMLVKGDGHVHLYPAHHLALGLTHLLANCQWLHHRPFDPAAVFIAAFLLESRRGLALADILEQERELSEVGIQAVAGPEPRCLSLTFFESGRLCLLAGRQIVTQERLEILGLLMESPVPDGLTSAETIHRIIQAGGIPVLAWAPGKWFFQRGHVVRRLLDEATPGRLLIGDTALRPQGWSTPALMRRARRRGFQIIGGSDPLPVAGEEPWMGAYGFIYEGPFDAERPVTSFRRILADPVSVLKSAGRRSGWGAVLRRLWQNQKIRQNFQRG